jgi:thiol:disulfide interchange protein DsbC
MYIFCDLDCPHCQRTEKFLPFLTNVTVHTFVMPVPSYHPDAPRKTNAIWCSPDKISAWNAWFETRDLPEDAVDCEAPLSEIENYAHAVGIYLPAVIFEDGQTYHAEDFIDATQSIDRLNELLAEHSQK